MTGRPRGTVSQTPWTGRCCGCCGDISDVLRGGGERLRLLEERKKLLVMLTPLMKRRRKVMVRMDLEEGCVLSPNYCDEQPSSQLIGPMYQTQ